MNQLSYVISHATWWPLRTCFSCISLWEKQTGTNSFHCEKRGNHATLFIYSNLNSSKHYIYKLFVVSFNFCTHDLLLETGAPSDLVMSEKWSVNRKKKQQRKPAPKLVSRTFSPFSPSFPGSPAKPLWPLRKQWTMVNTFFKNLFIFTINGSISNEMLIKALGGFNTGIWASAI